MTDTTNGVTYTCCDNLAATEKHKNLLSQIQALKEVLPQGTVIDGLDKMENVLKENIKVLKDEFNKMKQ